MARSLIYTVNTTTQSIADGGTVALGSVIRRYGCNLALSGNSILVEGTGYYDLDCIVIAAPTEAGTLTAQLYRNGVAIPGAIASMTVTEAGDTVALPIVGTIREACPCLGPISITCVLSGVASSVSDITLRITKT